MHICGFSMLQLKLLKMLYELQPVKATVLRSCRSIPIVDSILHKGSQTAIPRVIAEVLELYGIVETYDNLITQQDLAKIKFTHMQQRGSVPKIDDFFYIKVKNSIEKTSLKAKSEGDIALLRSVEKMQEDFIDISSTRVSLIFRAFQLGGIDIIERNCSLEEKVLINNIQAMYNKWLKEYAEVGRKS